MTYLEQTPVYTFPVAQLIQWVRCALSICKEATHPVFLPFSLS
jgi:hypothetical protein